MIIAIDGPAGTGKSTIAKLISEKLDIVFLNSGSFYRAITLALLGENKINESDEKICEFAKTLTLGYENSRLILNGKDVEDLLHSDHVDAFVAQISAIVPLRRIVNDKIREITKNLSIVCEGRDMTTVVFPDADYKFYLDASIDVQAQRRYKQGCSNMSLEQVKEAILKRDAIDKNKAEGSLKIASDAQYIDTSLLTIEQVCAIILGKINI
ncbi:MAG: (d)CMP kinase [Treponemataceae bacterium]